MSKRKPSEKVLAAKRALLDKILGQVLTEVKGSNKLVDLHDVMSWLAYSMLRDDAAQNAEEERATVEEDNDPDSDMGFSWSVYDEVDSMHDLFVDDPDFDSTVAGCAAAIGELLDPDYTKDIDRATFKSWIEG